MRISAFLEREMFLNWLDEQCRESQGTVVGMVMLDIIKEIESGRFDAHGGSE